MLVFVLVLLVASFLVGASQAKRVNPVLSKVPYVGKFFA